MKYIIEDSIFTLFPDFQRGVIVARGIDNFRPAPALVKHLSKTGRSILESGIGITDPRLEVWNETYRAFGADPKKDTPSIRFLIGQILKGKMPRSITTLVDAFNFASLLYVMPCGGDDLDMLHGDIHLGRATGVEKFSPLFRPDVVEACPPGEVIYFTPADGRVMCRRWNWRNADFSKIRPETTNVAINLDCMVPPFGRATLEDATEVLTETIREYCGGEVHSLILDSKNPSCTI